ncbi:hypothetical protein L210DRAFT_962180 [Boletus edulis BED1]|uniref:F-box domain-containing protein n=1 Tax=Boletus edulis BED1 TaxID=1328754 RepID=A0AAD4BIW2_BOLED|nr:hypothetical protein L210DRAFT_962180 [Boletus edulis BED1]
MAVDDPLYAQLFARPPAYDLVFACLSPRSLIQVAQTCRAASSAVTEFKNRAFNINRHFSRHFSSPIAFRSLQARTNTLVSGSNALQFLDRTFYPESDLDLYTHPGHSFEVAQFLIEVEGYHYVPRESQEKDWKVVTKDDWDGTERRVVSRPDTDHAYPMTSFKAVWTFKKQGVHQERLKVQIIEASSSPLESILGFHSTCVMNFISSDAAYSLYPMATFEQRCTLGMPSLRSSVGFFEAIEKYVKRGWRFYFVPTPNTMAHPERSPFFLEQARWVCDKHTWILPLNQTGVKQRPLLSPASPPLTCDPVLYNGWRFKRRGGDDGGYQCHYYPLRTTLFRYNYAIADEALAFTIRDWARQQGLFSHGRIPKEDWVWFDGDFPDSFMKVMD